MRKHMAIFAAASLAVAGISFSGLSHAQQDPGFGQPGQEQTGQEQQRQDRPGQLGQEGQFGMDRVTAQLPAGAVEAEDEQAKEDIKNAITEVTEAALDTDNGFGNLLEHLSQADRERLQDLEERDAQQLQEQISQLREAYQEKYDQEFALEADQVFTEDVQIAQGEVISPAILISWPVEPTQERDELRQPDIEQPGMEQPGMEQPGMPGEQDRQPGEFGVEPDQDRQPGQTGLGQDQDRQQDQFGQPGQAGTGQETDRQTDIGIGVGQGRPDAGDRLTQREHELEAGDKIAVVSFPESEEMPAITVSLVQEEDQWKLNLPDRVDAQTIEQNLTQGLQKISEKQDQWPDDAQKASAKFTQAVMMALYDVKADQASDPTQPGQFDQPGALPGQEQDQQQDRQPGQIGY